MELWDIYDENKKKTGKVIERGQQLSKGQYHLVVHVWIKSSNEEYLISKRTPNKSFPNMWESTGGSALAGEDSWQAALREVKEEIGITLSPENGKLIYQFKRLHRDIPDFLDVYLFKQNVDIEQVVYQPNEVCGAMWASEAKIRQMIEAGDFVNVFFYLEDLFNEENFI